MVILSLKVVLRAGLEPTTLCLEGRCSIQLSYRSRSIIKKRSAIPQNIAAGLQTFDSKELQANR